MRLAFVAVCAAATGLALGTVVPSFGHVNKTLTFPAVRLARRFDDDILANDAKWTEARCKGGRLVDLMLSSDAEAGPKIEELKSRNPPSARSEWQGNLKQELITWGWHDFSISSTYADFDHWEVKSVANALKINGKSKADGGNNIAYDVQHWDPDSPVDKKDQKYTANGEEYRVTQARHAFTVNPIDGVIIGQFLENPTTAATRNWYRKPAKEELPELRKLSDIFWGYWNRDNPNIANIRYLWMMDIANQDTEEILARALKEANKRIEEWPGVPFDINSDAGNAILGSVNGAVFAWFLIQHKEQLGNKWTSKVSVFINDSDESWAGAHIIFWVDDAPQRKPDIADIATEAS